MKNGAKLGRPKVKYVQNALDIIMASNEPVSTHELIAKLGLNEHEGIHLRRGLKRAEKKGEIKQIVRHPDGSFTWVPQNFSIETCAAHAANLYLMREKAELQIDPEQFEVFLKHEGLIQS